MKPITFFTAFLCLSLSAFAKPISSHTFQLKDLKFAASHAKNPQSGTLKVDSEKNTVTLQVQRGMPPCPAGMFCVQMMPAPLVVELPIVSVEDDACGIHHITALKDLRPVDGAMEMIELEDAHDMTCMTFAPVVTHAKYTTSFVDRIHGNEVKNESTMVIEPLDNQQADEDTMTLSQAFLKNGFSPMDLAKEGSLAILDQTVELDVNIVVNCPEGRACPAYFPESIHHSLPIIEKKTAVCGDKILARLEENGRTYEVEVRDSRHARCQMYVQHSVAVSYKETQKLQALVSEKTALFYFDMNSNR